MESRELILASSTLRYYRCGNGSRTVLCFHGYGESGLAFGFLSEAAGPDYCFLAPDLPLHGETRWAESGPFDRRRLKNWVEAILHTEGREEAPLILMGFSLGGRIALELYQLIPERVERMILLAPDGLRVNPWYWLATQTRAGNRLFALTMKKPGWFLGLLNGLNRLGLVNASVHKFVRYYIHDAGVREKLYRRWTLLRQLRPHLSRIRFLIGERQTAVFLIYGRHDRIIRPQAGKKFARGLENLIRIREIPAGHQLLHQKHLADILPALRND
jgi:pimeloyl-ACP methyl ester carboxylesterase